MLKLENNLKICPERLKIIKIICDFIDINDIDSAVAVDPDNKSEQEKCDFMVNVKEA